MMIDCESGLAGYLYLRGDSITQCQVTRYAQWLNKPLRGGKASAARTTAGRHLEDSPQCEDPAPLPLDKGAAVDRGSKLGSK